LGAAFGAAFGARVEDAEVEEGRVAFLAEGVAMFEA
jgi:hypothetical protein